MAHVSICYDEENNQSVVPRKISNWNLHTLNVIGVLYEENVSAYQTLLEDVLGVQTSLSDECTSIINYLTDSIDFEIYTDKHGIDFKGGSYRKDVDGATILFDRLEANIELLQSNKSEDTAHIYPNARSFLWRIYEYTVATYQSEQVYGHFFTDLMMNFGSLFNLIPESGASFKRVCQIGETMVTSIPDILYKSMNLETDFKTITIAVVSVAEFKQFDEFGGAPARSHVKTNIKLPSSEFHIHHCVSTEVLGRHGGELLAEWKYSVHKPCIFGMIVGGSKVILTSLKMEGREYHDELQEHGVIKEWKHIQYTRPMDLFQCADRKKLYEIFSRLGACS